MLWVLQPSAQWFSVPLVLGNYLGSFVFSFFQKGQHLPQRRDPVVLGWGPGIDIIILNSFVESCVTEEQDTF